MTGDKHTGPTVLHTGPTVLVVGNYRQALTIVRSLGKDCRIVVGRADDRSSCVEDSRFVATTWQHPGGASGDFFAAVRGLLQERSDISVIFPAGDDELFAVARLPEVTSGRIAAVIPSPSVIATCLDKASLLALADSLDIPQAPYRAVPEVAQLPAAGREVGFPCVVKSDHQLSRAFGEKAIICPDVETLNSIIAGRPEQDNGFIVQGYATGNRHNVYFAAQRGKLIGAMEVRVLRTTKATGTGYTVESVSVPLSTELATATARLIEGLDYDGIGHTQFMVDQHSGEISFLELNPRMGAAFAITAACGFDFPRVGLDLALGRPVSYHMLPPGYPIGRRFAWLYGDLLNLIRSLRSGEVDSTEAATWLYHAVRTSAVSDIHASWSWRDPVPAIKLLSRAPAKILAMPGKLSALLHDRFDS